MRSTARSFLVLSLAAASFGCSSVHKAEKLDTQIKNSQVISGDQEVGVKDGNMVFQRKVLMSEEVRKLQYEVYGLEDRVYGNRQYGSLGLYGAVRSCRGEVSSKKYGGDGKLVWTEPIDRVTDKDDDLKMGLDEKDKLIGLKEEFLKDRIERFRGYRNLLEKRQDEYEDKLAICKAELASKKFEAEKAAQPMNY
jgi:hypothetical protein